MNNVQVNEKRNHEFGKAFNYFLVTSFISIILKLCFISQSITDYLVEICAVCLSAGYLIIRLHSYKIKLFKPQDQYMRKISSKMKTHSYLICLLSYLFGEFIYLFVFKQTVVATLYLPVWILPTLIAIISTKKLGIYTSDITSNETKLLKSLKIRTTIGSIAFGLCLCGKNIYYNNTFHTDGILWTIYSAAAFGFLFYFLFKLAIMNNYSHKK